MNLYFGIRSTGNNLHIGHAMTLLNMFDYLKNNKVDTIYILLAEIHSEISTISTNNISENSKKLAKKIYYLYKTYLKYNNINNNNNINKLLFIFQNDPAIYHEHISLTYKFFPLISASKLLKNPIFKNSKNKSLGFLLYPVLQTFDVLLYHDNKKYTTVFLANDQRSNINTMKGIIKKLNINNIKLNINNNVIYDSNGKDKMSKSLNNFVNFDDIDGIEKYIIKYRTGSNSNDCYLYNKILKYFIKYFNIQFNNINCDNNTCFNCKNYFIKELSQVINFYNNIDDIKINSVSKKDIIDNYNYLLEKINNTRCDIK